MTREEELANAFAIPKNISPYGLGLMPLPRGFGWSGRSIVAFGETAEGVPVEKVVVHLTPDNWELFHELINSFLDMAIRHTKEDVRRSQNA